MQQVMVQCSAGDSEQQRYLRQTWYGSLQALSSLAINYTICALRFLGHSLA